MASLILRPGSKIYYIQRMVSGKAMRLSTGTDSLQVAKQKLRDFESALARGFESPLPTKTPTKSILADYVEHIRATKTEKVCTDRHLLLEELLRPLLSRTSSDKSAASLKSVRTNANRSKQQNAPDASSRIHANSRGYAF